MFDIAHLPSLLVLATYSGLRLYTALSTPTGYSMTHTPSAGVSVTALMTLPLILTESSTSPVENTKA